MKFRILALLLTGVLLGVWIARTNARRSKEIESANPIQSIAQDRAAAQGLLLGECSNQITGLRAVKEYSVNDLADTPTKWTGSAAVEYSNSLGGVDRTNLQFVFITPSGRLACILDPQWQHDMQMEHLNRALESAHQSK